MIFEGVKLMVVGMTTVMLFLTLMILFINLVSSLTKGSSKRELAALEQERALQAAKRKQAREKGTAAGQADADDEIAAIGAAVAAYEAERFASA